MLLLVHSEVQCNKFPTMGMLLLTNVLLSDLTEVKKKL